MNNNFKRTFFSSLMVILFVVSNLVGVKYTNFGDLILSVNFVTFPFIFLCVLLINNYCNKKEANSAVLSTALIQIFILLSYVIITNLGSQSYIPDYANYVNGTFKVNEVYIMANIVALLISNYILQYIYEYFRIVGHRFFGLVISILSSILLYGIITIPLINYGFGFNVILNIILCHVIMSFIMTLVIVILYYLLKDKEYPYNENKIFIKNINVPIEKNKIDKPIEEVIKITSVKNQVNKPKKKKKKQKKVNISKEVNKK